MNHTLHLNFLLLTVTCIACAALDNPIDGSAIVVEDGEIRATKTCLEKSLVWESTKLPVHHRPAPDAVEAGLWMSMDHAEEKLKTSSGLPQKF